LLLLAVWAGASSFQLEWKKDVSLSAMSLGVMAYGQWRLSQMPDYDSSFQTSDLLPWDRPWAGQWNPHADIASDLLTGAVVAPFVVGYLHDDELWTPLLMLSQVLALQSGVNLAVRSLAVWPRPFLLGSQGGEERTASGVSGSFYSGHSSAAFASATFTGYWFAQQHPESPYRKWIWTGSYLTATTIATLRVMAGKHYPSDVLVGAAVGSAFGWLIPWLHRESSERVSLSPLANGCLVHVKF